MSKVTMDVIAKKIGVSKTTVSRAFNNRNDISDELKKKILDAASEMGYVYNSAAGALKSNRFGTVGILNTSLIREEGEFFYNKINNLIIDELKSKGFSTMVMSVSDFDLKNIIAPIFLTDNKVDGLLIVGQHPKEYLESLDKFGKPIVLVDFSVDDMDYDSILTNNFSSSNIATKHLINSGCKRIGFIGNTNLTSSILERYLGFTMANMEAGYNIDIKYVIKEKDNDGNFIDIELPSDLPDAFLCNNDLAAYRLIEKLKELNIKVPCEIKVIGFDNTFYSSLSSPKITTMNVQYEAFATESSRLLIEKINGAKRSKIKLSFDANIIDRETV
ncbi:MAG: LacI family DNA-binding transcriptional regulator [Mycoplasmatales bacterium]